MGSIDWHACGNGGFRVEPCGPGRELANGGNRRYLAVSTRSREGPLTEPTAGAQPWLRERVLSPIAALQLSLRYRSLSARGNSIAASPTNRAVDSARRLAILSRKSQQGANLIEAEASLARAADKREGSCFDRPVHPPPAGSARWRGEHLDALVVANDLNIDPGTPRKLADRRGSW